MKKKMKNIMNEKKRDHFHYTGKQRGAAHSACNLKYQIPNKIPVVSHNGSKHDFHFTINELVKGMDGIRCFSEDKEKYITFKVPMKKENKNGKLITIKLKFIDSFRFMNISLSGLVYNLSKINKQECV